jgi:hypothetical protein
MTRVRAKLATRKQWPWWLLLAAWVCANSPQAAVYATLTWLAEARTFSHQQELTRQVAHVLGGARAEGRVAQALARMQATAKTPAPQKAAAPVPPAAVLKKIDLAAEDLVRAGGPGAPAATGWDREAWAAITRVTQPRHGPPRTG